MRYDLTFPAGMFNISLTADFTQFFLGLFIHPMLFSVSLGFFRFQVELDRYLTSA